MKAGTLRHILEIQVKTSTVNTLGERIDDYTTEVKRRGALVPLQGRELFQNRQIIADVTHKGTIRYYPLTPTHRVKIGARIFNVESVMHDDGRRIQTDFLAKESSS